MSFKLIFDLKKVVDQLNKFCHKRELEIVYFESNLNMIDNSILISEKQIKNELKFHLNKNLTNLISKYSKTFVYLLKSPDEDFDSKIEEFEKFEDKRKNGLVVDKIDKEKFDLNNLYKFLSEIEDIPKYDFYLLEILDDFFVPDKTTKINENEYLLLYEDLM